MLSFEPIRNNPVATLCVLLAGILGWVACNSLNAPPMQPHVDLSAGPPPHVEMVVARAAAVDDAVPTQSEYRVVSSDLLPRLKPGMSRIEIERVLGAPTPNSLDPVSLVDGRAVYRTAYELADPDMPHPVRPIRRLPQAPRGVVEAEAKSLVALDFDASQPGHPLIGINYLDPLF